VSAQEREHLSDVSIDVLIHGCKISRIAAVGITAVEKDERCIGIFPDNRLHVGWGGPCEGDVPITETGVELD